MNVASSFAAKTEEYFSQVPVPKIQEVADEVGVFYIYCLYLSVFKYSWWEMRFKQSITQFVVEVNLIPFLIRTKTEANIVTSVKS